LLFGLFGAIAGLCTGDWGFALAITAFGSVAGVLFGIGNVVVELVRERCDAPEPVEDTASSGWLLAGHLVGMITPPMKAITLIISGCVWLATKDYRTQRPGRRRRAAIGALFLGLFAILFILLVLAMIGPPPPGGATIWEAIGFVLFAAAVGAVLGFLSDSL
jgi:hypothetical protein